MIKYFPYIAVIFVIASIILIIISNTSINEKQLTSNVELTAELKAFEFEAKPISNDFTFYNKDGKELRLSDYKGNVILLNLWATWCAPCVAEMPSLDKLKELMANEKVQVIAVSVGKDNVDKIKLFYKKHEITNLEIFHDKDKTIYNTIRFHGLPTSILIDKEGNEIGRLNGDANWSSDEAVSFINSYL